MPNKPEHEQSPIQINTSDEISRGRYSNTLLVSHSPDEFILDWLLNSPNGPHLVSRIIMTPGNIKRVAEALRINIEQYEEKFGAINVVEPVAQKFH
ncbi:MAG: DUF3467 domain-containing protein [Deltaproteobacteria bacterium]|nr:DUF3467 domain-containing protein [Deltaproteobacteria bacterium]